MIKLIDRVRNMISDINSIDDLNIISDIIKRHRLYLGQKNSYDLVIGDKVKIVGSGKIQEGIIEKINRTRAIIMVGNIAYNVPFEMIRKEKDELNWTN